MKPKPHTTNLLASFQFAWAGLVYVARTERNFKIHLVATVLVLCMAAWLRVSRESLALLALTISMVLTAEIFNTAAELLVDLASPDYHPLAKSVKDLAAGAVLLTAIMAVVVGLLILGPPLWARLLMLV